MFLSAASMRSTGIALKAVESASAAVAVGATTVTLRYRFGDKPVAGLAPA